MPFGHHPVMVVGVVDVGANTIRLQVSRGRVSVYRAKAMLKLGEWIERLGRLPAEQLDEAAAVVGAFAAEARRNGTQRLEVLVTSPGRQAENGAELIERLAQAAAAPARVLDALEEGRLAFLGATTTMRIPSRRLIGVVDVGGGSAQIAVGTRRDGAAWVRSLDIGSLRLTGRMGFGDPPGEAAIAAARMEVERHLDGFAPPLPHVLLAVGGSARALKPVAGPELGTQQLDDAIALLARLPAEEVVSRFGVDHDRALTLPAGTVILAAIRERLNVPLVVARGGVREGAVIELERRRAAA
jgi:exopolyphosphatase / guanosine-5'-triphosphate,3'-diphosphate pyrophosphatase